MARAVQPLRELASRARPYGLLEGLCAVPGPDNLVLLFYDGYERQAEEAPLKRLKAETKRFARMAWRTLRRKQVWTGRFMTYRTLRLGLERAGYIVKVNDFAAARRYPAHPIGAGGYVSVSDRA